MRKRISDSGIAAPREINPPEMWAKFHRLLAEWLFIGDFFRDAPSLQTLMIVVSHVILYGRPNRPNWVRMGRRQLTAATKLSPSTVSRAMARLLEARLVVRNKQDATLYRIPTSLLSIGAMNLTKIRDDLLPHPQEVIAFQLVEKKTAINDSVSSAKK